ncbi:MAG TPA: HEAT repeat domain-containing protein, partial [Pirellulales bacterium]|nr:HEAT repeat domain-containing protein [Pirellulales bacterium]
MKKPRLMLRITVCFAIITSVAPSMAEEGEDELVGLVVGLLGDQDKDVRALGLEQVRTAAKGPAATRQFAAQLPKLPPEAQVGLLSALADRGDTAARPAVLDVLSISPDEPVRVAAIAALGLLGGPDDTHQLVTLLSESSPPVKAAAGKSLVNLRGQSVAVTIAAEMKKAAPPLRVALIEVLATRRALDTIPDILSAAVDDNPAVRAAAMTALGQLAGAEHVPGMVQGVVKAERGRERESAEKCVLRVCGRIEDADKRAEPLLAAMDKLEQADRNTMLSTVGRVGGPAALKIVEAAIADDDPKLHENGLRALCNWPNASVAARLIELAATDEHSSHRTMALRSLIRVAPLRDDRTDAARLQLLNKAMAMCTRDAERKLVLDRARAIRTLDSLNFILPYVDQPTYAEQACLSIVELAHHRGLREPHKAEFHQALDKVIQASKDATVIDRANR